MIAVERLVVDASALGALVFREGTASRIARRLDGAALLAPDLLPYELASICATKARREPSERTRLQAALRRAGDMRIELTRPDPVTLAALAGEYGLTAYDAAYLQVALAAGCPLVTLDTRLERAWRAAR